MMMNNAQQSLQHELRLLKQAGDYQRPDYSVLSVTVMTLGLIIMVEFVKHKIDHMAHGKRYFTAVLQTFYAECMYTTQYTSSSLSSVTLSLSLPEYDSFSHNICIFSPALSTSFWHPCHPFHSSNKHKHSNHFGHG
jgi:hypothetical protein